MFDLLAVENFTTTNTTPNGMPARQNFNTTTFRNRRPARTPHQEYLTRSQLPLLVLRRRLRGRLLLFLPPIPFHKEPLFHTYYAMFPLFRMVSTLFCLF